MGGESSKHAAAAGAARSRERKRSGLSNAFAGGDCRSTSNNPRPNTMGPSYGSAPEHIPAAPVKCTPVPIESIRTLGADLTWIPDTEATLITEWNHERQKLTAAGLRRSQPRRNGDSNGGGPAGSSGDSSGHASPGAKQSSSGSPTAAAGDQATPGVASSAGNLVPLNCDCAPATTGRSTGLIFRVPTTWAQPGFPGSGSSLSRSPSWPSSLQVATDQRGGSKKPSAGNSPCSPVVISALPVGIEYYRALQTRWTTPEARSMPPATEEEDLNDSLILEAVADPDCSVLSPPVPLGYMIDLFVPQWRAEGLFDQAEHGNSVR
ncbi:hypothetical protein ABB37_09430 [Leptomonas pyrrhocoris]|uniref:Uncharacterized protein n=1 Tax=Leptomonas pyrrhocoris TaxID=157538 RepID=A0A0M9FQW4_LEPPY|nr:hypothetical protein ABB37_09430 [Leptomonas pyrrhocoris]XP_015652604.1 hypothetical protein ABB37_09430 [Leptomonas pyrrhocoris]XP_015652605.1 hypothetical protein ABB37_09430 [Leptomonas pyrrhocoris]XP_015652606.1 hypothetical protein ABB37_09430 [Leptomonas pyrrhocoris]KPA74164.1 hypothetical protein ABB37_09430 [Leptomonas pyrrhocoris]KPA74165.1 hypothetical protein ABB37_09430 [Leptomonas pyrrhocoris]KPA74166.1 hypothetical protein ABB37_09430 [Leptomonas pyrrhocoris]KPA74167.1 hypot|eukprot:XP_015652603.1 hypothetical protein ABB37_09430 [Leptomonas pyrrhocoris]